MQSKFDFFGTINEFKELQIEVQILLTYTKKKFVYLGIFDEV